jgi:hypothetical protein
MKVAIVLAADGTKHEDAILAPFRSASFVDGLKIADIDPVMVSVVPDHVALGPAGEGELRCRRAGLGEVIAGTRPDAIQTVGPERGLPAIWRIAADIKAPLVHCVSSRREGIGERDGEATGLASLVPSLAMLRARRGSRHVDALIGTSRAAVGGLMTGGYFPRAAFSVIVPPPVERAAAAVEAASARASEPVFGIYDPGASADLIAFVSHAIQLTGRPNALQVRIALHEPPPAVAPPLSFVAADGIDGFLAGVDVLAVPAYDDSVAAALIAALRSGKSVIVPDRGGAAELIEYGRHGLMFSAGSAYHFANAMNIVSQSWSQKPVLLADGGPAIARTHPAAVAHSFAAVYARLLAVTPSPLPLVGRGRGRGSAI